MSPRWREALVRLHPRPWRDAHGTEFSALLEDTPWSVAAVADVVRHAARVGRQVHPRRWAVLAAVVVFGLLDAVSMYSGVTHNLLWAPTTPYRAFALAVTVGPFAVLGAWLVRRSSRSRGEADVLLRILRTVAAAPIWLVGGLTAAFAVARAVWYPFWAAGASAEDLGRSWGGPTAVGATLAHWAVAAALLAAGWALLRLAGRLRPTRRAAA